MTTLARATLSTAVQQRAEAMIDVLAERLLEHAADPNLERTPYYGRGLSGAAGLAITFAALAMARKDVRYEHAMHQQLAAASSMADSQAIGAFTGIAGLRAAAEYAMQVKPLYGKLVAQCDAHIEKFIMRKPTMPLSVNAYDLVSGWAGARLCRHLRTAGERDGLISNIEWTISQDEHWRCDSAQAPGTSPRSLNDIGLAHGLAGMLASVALTTDPAREPMLREKVVNAAYRLHECRTDVGGYSVWARSLQETANAQSAQAAWCYGLPGIAAAISAVGVWAAESALRDSATLELARFAEHFEEEWTFLDEALCHGVMGVAMIYASVGFSTGEPALLAATEHLVTLAIDRLEASGGVCRTRGPEMQMYDAVGVLDGIAGIALSLATLTSNIDASWMRLHALLPIR